MKKALTAGLVLAGVLAVTGSAFAAKKPAPEPEPKPRMQIVADKVDEIERRSGKKPALPPAQRPPVISRDRRPTTSPSPQRPPMSRDTRPPMPPRSGDRRPQDFGRVQPR
ncbi:MAG: hypothetical protein IJP86_03710 [Synergistaceae bacterium]|nr:hypothetical protein [Synergistaceae bacterium]